MSRLRSTLAAIAILAVARSAYAGAVETVEEQRERSRVSAVPLQPIDEHDATVADVVEKIARQVDAKVTFDDASYYRARMDCHVENTNAVDFLDALGHERNFSVAWRDHAWTVHSQAIDARYPVRHLSPELGATCARELSQMLRAFDERGGARGAVFDVDARQFVVHADRTGQEQAELIIDRVDRRARNVRLTVSLFDTPVPADNANAVLAPSQTRAALVRLLAHTRGAPVTKVGDVSGGAVRHFAFDTANAGHVDLDVAPFLNDALIYLDVVAQAKKPIGNGKQSVDDTQQRIALNAGGTFLLRVGMGTDNYLVAITPTAALE